MPFRDKIARILEIGRQEHVVRSALAELRMHHARRPVRGLEPNGRLALRQSRRDVVERELEIGSGGNTNRWRRRVGRGAACPAAMTPVAATMHQGANHIDNLV